MRSTSVRYGYRRWFVVLLTACVLLSVGCKGSGMKTFRTVKIVVDSSVQDSFEEVPTFRVDLIGLRPGNVIDGQVRGMSATDYYASDARRHLDERGLVVSRPFTRGSDREDVIDGIPWSQWRENKVRELMIVDNLHGVLADVGSVDFRKQIVPLDSRRWKRGDKTLTVHIRLSGVDFDPSPQPK